MGLGQQAWLSTTPTIAQFGFVQQGLDSGCGCWQRICPLLMQLSFSPALEPMTPCQAQKLHIGSSSVIWRPHGLALFLISHVALGKSFNRSWCPP